MTYDKDSSGAVSIDETMSMLYARYGKERLEKQMKSLFGEDLKTEDGDGELDYCEYLKAVSVRFPNKGGKQKHKK
jgi:Ca2+-binding EF-hand superfamily protein